MTNEERAREAWTAYIEAGYDNDVVRKYFADDCTYEDPPESPDSRVWPPGSFDAFIDNFVSTWDDYELELLDIAAHGDETVISEVRLSGYARGTTTPVQADLGFVGHYRDGLVYRYRVFFSRESAVAALDQESAGAASRS